MTDNKSKPEAGSALHDLFREVFVLHAAVSGIMDKVHLQAGLIPSQHKIMGVLIHTAPATVPDIAARLGLSRQFVQTVCNDLSSSGFIEFANNPRHKRSKLVVLTKTGRTAFRKARQKENSVIEQSLPEIDLEEAIQGHSILEKIRKSLPVNHRSR